ncbi:putative major facilitator superfamily transporter [Nocardia brasiliensis NBRC 14402]|uniref:MFS transporter n=1 Tax=Nocardia brasiliensis TaxID=37326 RepID=UPI0002DB1959|nr:MFS transporter [Nocardia brasiliensis]ASF07060.1 MFS transporter [Nocardia brasiliensis]GAJ84458.1 putative major facilitator superfamily transporter [Nocardia brasiliensis NBRC 14402]SUB47685.1 enterobactin exporter EntS [Nocardia brasiliensis]
MVADTRPLAHAGFRRIFLGQSTAVVGMMVTSVTVAVQLFSLTGSSLVVGLAGLVGLVPTIVFGLYGGAVADAIDRRKLYLFSSSLTWAITLALLAQSVLGIRSPALILVLVAVQAGGFAVSAAVRGALIPMLVPAEQLPAANALNYTAGTLGQVLGPLLAGVLLALPHGFALAYGADAVLFTAALYAAARLPPLPAAAVAARPGLRSVFEGLRFLATNPVLSTSFALDTAAMVLAMPTALFPQAAAERWHGGAGVGVLYSAIAVGALLAGVFGGWIGRVRRQGVALGVAVVVWAAAIAAAGAVRSLWAVVGLLVLAGAADLVSAVYRETMLQTQVPDGMRGRLQGVFTVVVAGGPRLGDLRAGAMAAATTLTIAWSGGALVCIAVAVMVAMSVRSFWRYDSAART